MKNINKHIDEFLKYYCELKSPEYAVMLKGKWGSGKTFYINKFKDILSARNKKYIYVSLYGVSSYDEIETKFLEVLHPMLYNKKTILLGKIAKGFLKGTLKIDLDDDGKADGSVSGQVSSLGTHDILNTQNHILIFDDLERCSIPINNILGYINYFVEHQSYKVILIANEDELKKSKKYKEIKEKLIGKVFEITSHVDLAIESFIKQIKKNDIEKVVSSNIKTIKQVYKISGYDNLRLLRQTILDFARFYDSVIREYENQSFIQDIIKLFFVLSIENKNDTFNIQNLRKNNINTMLTDKKSQLTEYEILNIKYKIDLSYNGIFELNLWKDIINKSIINKDEITKAILSSRYYINEESPNWKKLWNFHYLKDDEFDIVYKITKDDLIDKNYNNIFEVVHIYITYIYLNDINLIKIDKNKMLDLAKENINYMYKNELIDNSIFEMQKTAFRRNSYDGLVYMDTTSEYYGYIKDYVNEIIKKGVSDNSKRDAESIINQMGTDDDITDALLAHDNGQKNSYVAKPILNYMDVGKLTAKLIYILHNGNINAIRNFGYIFDDRYSHDFYNKQLVIEMDFLNQLKVKLTIEQIKLAGKPSGYNLQNFIEYLQKGIDDLQKYVDSQ